MGKSWGDREALDASEPRVTEEGSCPLCGTRVAQPYEPGGTVLCHPDRGGCGAIVRPVPFLVPDLGEAVDQVTVPARTSWGSCCLPYFPARPSGIVARHSQSCGLYPSERLTHGELQGWKEENRARRDHPAGSAVEAPVAIMADEGYVDAHIDDDD